MLLDELALADVEFDVDYEESDLEPPIAPWRFLTTLSRGGEVGFSGCDSAIYSTVLPAKKLVSFSNLEGQIYVWIEARAVFAAINQFVKFIPSASFGASAATTASAVAARPSVTVLNPSLGALTAAEISAALSKTIRTQRKLGR